MSFNFKRLRGKIIEKYGSQAKFAESLGVSQNSLSRKMNNKTRFSSNDVIKIKELLGIPDNEINSYFFNMEV